jgi:hypothetical protein
VVAAHAIDGDAHTREGLERTHSLQTVGHAHAGRKRARPGGPRRAGTPT